MLGCVQFDHTSVAELRTGMSSACELSIRNKQKEKQEQNISVKWLFLGDHKKEFEEVIA